MVNENLPDLVILDVVMPQMDCIATCRQMRDLSVLAQTLIAFLTAINEEYVEIAGFNAGADNYTVKPISSHLLSSGIKAIVRRHELYQKNHSVASKLIILDLLIGQDSPFWFIRQNKKLYWLKKNSNYSIY